MKLAMAAVLIAATAFAQEVRPAAVVHPAFPSGSSSALGRNVAALVSEPAVSRAHWGVAVTAMDGTPLYGMNEGQFFRPASNAKLFTTAAAMALLGSGSKLTTRVLADGSLDADGTLHGNVTLYGSGDATLSEPGFPYVAPALRKPGTHAPDPLQGIAEMARQIAAGGVKRVEGDVVGSDAEWPWQPYAEAWTVDDLLWGYGAPVSALTVGDNLIELHVVPGIEPGVPARVTLVPDVGYYTVEGSVLTAGKDAADDLRVDRVQGSRVVRLMGQVPTAKPHVEELAVEEPALYGALALKYELGLAGVTVTGEARGKHTLDDDLAPWTKESHEAVRGLPVEVSQPKAGSGFVCDSPCKVLAQHEAAPLREDVRLTMKVSQNLHAEMLLRRLGKQYGTAGSGAQGVRVVRQWLVNAGLDGEDFSFFDGSGLSEKDVVTPRATVQLLAFAARQPWFADWKAALPVAGVDGSLVARYKDSPLKGKVFAKTGTLGETRALSGYVEAASGRTVIFSVMVDTHAPGNSADREAMDKIVAAIAASN